MLRVNFPQFILPIPPFTQGSLRVFCEHKLIKFLNLL